MEHAQRESIATFIPDRKMACSTRSALFPAVQAAEQTETITGWTQFSRQTQAAVERKPYYPVIRIQGREVSFPETATRLEYGSFRIRMDMYAACDFTRMPRRRAPTPVICGSMPAALFLQPAHLWARLRAVGRR